MINPITLLSMNSTGRLSLWLLFSLLSLYIINQTNQVTSAPASDEHYVNLEERQVEQIRFIIHKAGSMYASNIQMVSKYIQDQVKASFPSRWNVLVYRAEDWRNGRIFLTGVPNNDNALKRFYQVTTPETFNFSIVILQTTYGDHEQALDDEVRKEGQGNQLRGLQFTKKKSPFLSASQEAGIDLAMTTAYTWNKNVIDFTKVAQRLSQTNLNQHWQVCTFYQSNSQVSFKYESTCQQWIEYYGYGLGSFVIRVYLYRNNNQY